MASRAGDVRLLKESAAIGQTVPLALCGGLLCGFLSGALAFTLPASLALAIDTIFPRTVTVAGGAVVTWGPVETRGSERL